jgi:predicted acetyltransferase
MRDPVARLAVFALVAAGYTHPMDLELIPASSSDRPVLAALLQLYLYDFSEIVALDVDEQGVYSYPYLDDYWTEPGRRAFLIRSGGRLAGFALVRTLEAGDDPLFQLAEFFIMRRFRCRGLGRAAAVAVFDRFPGRWEVGQVAENTAARSFWRRVIGDYTGGRFVETWREGEGPTQWFSNRDPG